MGSFLPKLEAGEGLAAAAAPRSPSHLIGWMGAAFSSTASVVALLPGTAAPTGAPFGSVATTA